MRLRRRPVVGGVLAAGAVLIVVSTLWQSARARGWDSGSAQLDIVLDIDHDLAVMNWLSAMSFLLAALLAVAAAQGGGSTRRAWYLVAGGLALVSLSETAPLHDPAVDATVALLSRGELWTATSAVLAGAALVVAAWLLRDLERHTLLQLAAAGVLLLCGSVLVDRFQVDGVGPEQLAGIDLARVALEEGLELLAACVALDAVLRAVLGTPHPPTDARGARLRR